MPAQRAPVPRRLGRMLGGLAALTVLAGLLVGAPLALLAFVGNPLPDHVPSLGEFTARLATRDEGQLFLRALALLGWAGWATFAVSALVEIAAQLLRLPVPRLPGFGTQQRVAATLVGSTLMLLTAGTAATAVPPATSGYAAVVNSPTGAGAGVLPPARAVPPAAAAGDTAAAGGTAADEAPRGPVYRVRRGDYLGGIADRYLGDFDRYRELAKLNKLRNPDRILPGQRVRLPSEARDTGPQLHATGSTRAARPEPPSGRLPSDNADPGRDNGIPRGPFDPEAFAASPASAAAGPGGGGAAERRTAGQPAGDQPAAGQPAPEQPAAGVPAAGVPAAGVPAAGVPAAGEAAAGVAPAGQASGEAPVGGDGRGRLALAAAAVVSAAGVAGAQIGVLLGLRRRRP